MAGVRDRCQVRGLILLLLVLLVQYKHCDSHVNRCWSSPVAPYLVMHQCYRDLCRCNNYTLDCSSNRGRLTYVPRVQDNVQVLNFSNNHLLTLPPAFFVNVSHTVWLLDLYNNGLSALDPLAFSHLPRLSALLIGGNVLNYSALAPVLAVPTLRRLDIKCGGLGSPPDQLFVNMSLANSLEYLDLSWNQIHSLDMAVLQPLHTLRNFSVWDSKMYELKTAYLPSVQYFSFHNNLLPDFPETCKPDGTDSLFPSLGALHLDFNDISQLDGPVCLPALKHLDLKYNRLVHLETDMFSTQRFPAMEALELTGQEKQMRRLDNFAFNNSALVKLYLGINLLDFSDPRLVDVDIFGGLSSVEVLFLDHNNFEHVTDERLHSLLRHLPRLQLLYLGFCQITHITPSTFSTLTALRDLKLYGNWLTNLPDAAFDGVARLTHLDVGSNHLPTVSASVFDHTLRQRLQRVDLSNNPFQCGCDVRWFQAWLTQKPHQFLDHNDQGYRCANVDNTTVQQFYINPQACILSTVQSILTIVFTSLIILVLAGWSLCFGYRWHWRLWLYEVCRGRDRPRSAGTPPRSCTYDVFVAYAEEDVEWVLDELLPVLEGRWGLRVCIHQRDFIPGKHIIDNISDCVEDSHKLLMVFSPHFARSEWCQFELKMCQTCVMERNDVLVVVTLQETVSRDLTGAMLAVMRTTTYIEWGDCRSGRASFFGRLSMALSDVMAHVSSLPAV